MPESRVGYTVEALALNVTILEIVLALVAFVVAALGFFGYAGIKEAAKDVAEKEARKVANEQMTKFKREQESDRTGQSESVGDFNVGEVPVDKAEPAKGE